MGGLVVRAYIRRYGIAKLARVLTIGAPHHGSVHAWLMIGTSLGQIRPGNPWLVALNRERLDPALRFVSLWSWHDSMVAPQTSAELPGAVDMSMIGVGHNALLGDAEVFDHAHAEIDAARADSRRANCLFTPIALTSYPLYSRGESAPPGFLRAIEARGCGSPCIAAVEREHNAELTAQELSPRRQTAPNEAAAQG
jgi:hypothetical protein